MSGVCAELAEAAREPGEDWAYGYPHEAFVAGIDRFEGETVDRHISPPPR